MLVLLRVARSRINFSFDKISAVILLSFVRIIKVLYKNKFTLLICLCL
jgi:hypothetical protein